MRLYDAYRLGVITQIEYARLIESGQSPNSMYNIPGTVVVVTETLNYFSGTTTSTLTDVLESNVVGSIKQSVSVKNLGSTNSLNVSIEYYVANILSNTITDVVLPTITFFMETISAISTIIVKVQDTISGNHTTFETGIAFS